MLQTISHPTKDSSLPSFVHPALADVNEELQLVNDCWELLRNGKEPYLPKEPKEPPRAYKNRLLRSSYPSFYRDAIIAYAGALSRFELRDAPELLRTNQSNIDSDKVQPLDPHRRRVARLPRRHANHAIEANQPKRT